MSIEENNYTNKEQKINLNQFEKIVTKIEKQIPLQLDKEYNISMGNDSYYKIVTKYDFNTWDLLKINKKSKNILYKEISYKEIFNILLDIAINNKKDGEINGIEM